MTNIIRIAGAIASHTGITLYAADGQEVNLTNDGWKTKTIMDIVTAPLANGAIIEIDLDKFSVEKVIEDKTEGVIRFIRKTMEQLGEMLADLEGKPTEQPTVTVADPAKQELVAVVKTPTGDVEIGGMDKLEKHIERAATSQDVKGLTAFMQRIAAVQADRGHTIQELLNFMSKGDLPIADDGSIVAYKVLKTAIHDHLFADCHTGKVFQKLGSRVSMDEKLVDRNRRTECSTGLHIARRGYLRGFDGDIIVLVKVAPEDVMAVPVGEPDKMRAAAYHIVAVLPKEVHPILRSNMPMTGHAGASKMLADVIAGNHVGILEEVRIGEAKGKGLKVEKTDHVQTPIKAGQNGSAKALDDQERPEAVTPKSIRAAAQKAVAEAPKTAPASTETKAERDARKKREKRAAERLAKEAATATVTAPRSPPAKVPITESEKAALADKIAKEVVAEHKAAPKTPSGAVETKAQRDARKKREKRAAEKAARPTRS